MNSKTSAPENDSERHTKSGPGVILVMGVSGCGKSTVAERIAEALQLPFVEADSLHPASNIQKMSAGTPLTDDDRQPWLEQVRDECKLLCESNGGCVVACSALKRHYRQTLAAASPGMAIVFLHGSFNLIHTRMSARTGHFMPDTLLKSQFDALEDPRGEAHVVTIDIDLELPALVDTALTGLKQLNHPVT